MTTAIELKKTRWRAAPGATYERDESGKLIMVERWAFVYREYYGWRMEISDILRFRGDDALAQADRWADLMNGALG